MEGRGAQVLVLVDPVSIIPWRYILRQTKDAELILVGVVPSSSLSTRCLTTAEILQASH